MKKQELREIKLLELLKKQKRLDVDAVTSTFNISEATARRLFAKLETEKKLIRTHGGIQSVPELNVDYSFQLSASHSAKEKEIIGEAAVELLANGDHLFLDAGTTTLKMGEALSLKLQCGDLKNITVYTNSLSFLNNLAEHCEAILIGGKIRPGRRDVCGPLARHNLEKLRFDKVFFGVDAISPDGDLMTTDAETAEINSLFISHSREAYVLADSEKFNRFSCVSFACLDDVDKVLTDNKISPKILALYKRFTTKITIKKPDNQFHL